MKNLLALLVTLFLVTFANAQDAYGYVHHNSGNSRNYDSGYSYVYSGSNSNYNNGSYYNSGPSYESNYGYQSYPNNYRQAQPGEVSVVGRTAIGAGIGAMIGNNTGSRNGSKGAVIGGAIGLITSLWHNKEIRQDNTIRHAQMTANRAIRPTNTSWSPEPVDPEIAAAKAAADAAEAKLVVKQLQLKAAADRAAAIASYKARAAAAEKALSEMPNQ